MSKRGLHPNSRKNLRPENGFKKGHDTWNKGNTRKISAECVICFTRFKYDSKVQTGKYCSVECYSIGKRGEGNHNWIGGGWLYVRKQVLVLQDYTCQNCGLREPDIMEVNHKLERSKYPELSRDINNMEVLCPNCHRRKTNAFLRTNKQEPKLLAQLQH